jgi:FKBP-type peptidyl-prolyl cis-trans isomerase FkpA/FKBP-type peptidyl-prolyl cis-trans isomerase FklB
VLLCCVCVLGNADEPLSAVNARKYPDARYNLRSGTTYLAKMEQKPGVIKTESGLLYKVLKRGAGKVSPRPHERGLWNCLIASVFLSQLSSVDIFSVSIHFRGTTIDGKEFENSHKNKRPANALVQNMLAGFREALGQMVVGDKWKLYMHPDIGYWTGHSTWIQNLATKGIEKNMVLVYTLELVALNPPPYMGIPPGETSPLGNPPAQMPDDAKIEL